MGPSSSMPRFVSATPRFVAFHRAFVPRAVECPLNSDFYQTPLSITKPRKAVALISGGLDSMLAARLMRDQGIHVEGINFFTGFCVEGHTHAIRASKQNKPKRNNALGMLSSTPSTAMART